MLKLAGGLQLLRQAVYWELFSNRLLLRYRELGFQETDANAETVTYGATLYLLHFAASRKDRGYYAQFLPVFPMPSDRSLYCKGGLG